MNLYEKDSSIEQSRNDKKDNIILAKEVTKEFPVFDMFLHVAFCERHDISLARECKGH